MAEEAKDCSSDSMATQLSLKLLIDAKAKRVLFAEASKEVVDFLFSLLAIPLGSVIKLLTKEDMVGSMGNVYNSIETLDKTYLQSDHNKSLLLNPAADSPSMKNALFLTEGSSLTSTAKKGYRCAYNSYDTCKNYYSDICGASCGRCGRQMTGEMQYVAPKPGTVTAGSEESIGFVKGVVTYTVLDDLTVMPMSAISSITMLSKFSVKDISSLAESTVNLGIKEGLALLKASLESKTVLTDVFLGKKAAASAC